MELLALFKVIKLLRNYYFKWVELYLTVYNVLKGATTNILSWSTLPIGAANALKN